MSLWSRIGNVFRGDRVNREIDEEFEAHIADAIEAGVEPVAARKAFGPALRHREESRDIRLVPWLDSLRADVIFGWRQLRKKKVTSAAAILSLALAIGACLSAFRLIDGMLLRPLPVAHPEQLYSLALTGIDSDGQVRSGDTWAYPSFRLMQAAVQGQAELLAISPTQKTDVTYGSVQETEKALVQYVSGEMFTSFGLRPALGRLLSAADDQKPGSPAYAVLSHDYWTHRFGADPNIVGRTFHMGDTLYQIIGVADGPFTGTERGTATEIFVPAMMHPAVLHSDWTWIRIMARVKPGAALETVRAKLGASWLAFERERAKGFSGMSQQTINIILSLRLSLEPAAAGASDLQREYRRSLVILGVLVILILLIACANVANLMAAQAAARAREMALRVSLGAGRWRLVQLVVVESATLALAAAATGGCFAWWSAPFIVGMINPPDNPAQVALPADWRVLAFGACVTLGVTCLLGLAPALRASAVKPASALKGGEDAHSRRRLMHSLIAAQVALCFVVLFVAGLFAATFEHLANRPTGFSAARVLTLDTIAQSDQPDSAWDQMAAHLRTVPGVEGVAMAGWPLLGGGNWNGFISLNGAPPGPVLAYFLRVSPGWANAMKIPFIAGRDFLRSDTSPGSALINEAFARQYFDGVDPIGKWFAKGGDRYQVVGILRDAPYSSIREPIVPVAYVPMRSVDANGAVQPMRETTFIVRTASANPLALASSLRRAITQARPDFRVSDIRTQAALVTAQTVRERLLAMLGFFFAVVALLLAGVGLYGVLDYSVLQRRREIGIRMAIGARAGDVARRVTADVFLMVVTGACAGLALGMISARYLESLLYQVKATDAAMLALPALAIFSAALLAALPAVIRAVRIDPAAMLRSE